MVKLKGETLMESAMPTKIPLQKQGDRMVNAAMQRQASGLCFTCKILEKVI